MSTKRIWMTAAAVALLAVGTLFAQRPGRRAMAAGGPDGSRALTFLTDYLSLTASQQEQAKAIFAAGKSAAQPVVQDMKTLRTQAEAAVKANDTKSIDSLSAAIGKDMGQLSAIRLKGMAQLYAILTPEQQTKAANLRERMHGMMAGRFGM